MHTGLRKTGNYHKEPREHRCPHGPEHGDILWMCQF